MFTFENTKEATHIYSNTQFLKIKNGKYEFINSATNFEWEDGGAAEETHFGAMELSYPPGERKEDHTDMDGVVTYALKYKLDDNPDDQVIETWVGDHITEQKESACPGEPVFTQEMERKGELPPVGCEVGYNTASRGDIVGVVTGYRTWKSLNTLADNCDYRVFVTFEHNERLLKDVWPIDNRTDEEKLKSALMDSIVWNSTWENNVDELMASDKFTITLKD